jgi:hypothetical protein
MDETKHQDGPSPRPPPHQPSAATQFEAVEAAVMETETGRWFLAEFARRNRAADTEAVLAAIDRLRDGLHEKLAPAIASGDAASVIGLTEVATAEISLTARKLAEVSDALRAGGIDPRISEAIDLLAGRIVDAAATHEAAGRRLRDLASGLIAPHQAGAARNTQAVAIDEPSQADLTAASEALVEAIGQFREVSGAPQRPTARAGDPLAGLSFAERHALFS